jgi:probable selenium-dependent hydroxylase accessory protein YqeC
VTSLSDLLGLGSRELVAIVGGGGKSTLLFGLGNELAATGRRVVLTTTTKMGRYQITDLSNVCWSADTGCVIDALDTPGPVMLLTDGDDHKVTGPSPEAVDHLFAAAAADYIIVEADGSHGRPLKAPASHEPVVPSATTTVVILMGIDAVGRRLDEATHRVEEAMRFTGLAPDHILTPGDCATILTHPEGALRVCPSNSRVVVGLTKVGSAADIRASAEMLAATDIANRVGSHPSIAAVVVLDTALGA